MNRRRLIGYVDVRVALRRRFGEPDRRHRTACVDESCATNPDATNPAATLPAATDLATTAAPLATPR